jgi:RimJ/RimL family protein N-acetyltransferase
MTYNMPSRTAIAHKLPDIPRWVEVHSYLQSDECEVLAYSEVPSLSFILRVSEESLIYVVGEPTEDMIRAVADGLGTEGTVIAPQDQHVRLAPLLPAWLSERIFVYTLATAADLPHDKNVVVRFLEPNDLDGTDIDPELVEELEDALEYTRIAAVYVVGRPVSFCYASSETATLWDVGIDTVPEHQRKGYAGLCFSFLARHMDRRGKSVVWQALESNPASWCLADKLGFMKVDELAYFTRQVQG